jgi:hypothetical protein
MRMVPLAGLEPAQCCHYLILSQARLPIPPQGQARDHSREARGVNGPHLPSVPRPSERPSSAMRHKFTREREPGPRAPGTLLPSLRDRWSARVAPGSRVSLRSPGTRETSHTSSRHPPHHRIRAR